VRTLNWLGARIELQHMLVLMGTAVPGWVRTLNCMGAHMHAH